MIISHRHRFIFVHCPKTGGSSVTAYLARSLGPRDLQVGAWYDAYAAGARPNLRAWIDVVKPGSAEQLVSMLFRKNGPANMPANVPRHIYALNQAQKKKYIGVLGRKPPHASGQQIRAFAPDPWQRYFKFCFVRNPFDRVLSYHVWRQGDAANRATFAEFLRSLDREFDADTMTAQFLETWPLYTIDDEIVVDFVGRYESIVDDMKRICETIGTVAFNSAEFPHAKNSARDSSYRDWYGPEEKAVVERLFGKELSAFHYDF